jgi:hypothetical protein
MKKEEVRVEKDSTELARRWWSSGECADEDPISPGSVWEREVTSGVKDEADGR